MSEIVKTRITPTEEVEAPLISGPVQPKLQSIESKTGNEATDERQRLDIWEHEKGHKYAENYFGFRELIAGDFNLKMNVSRIDRYIKEEISENSYDNTIDTYNSLLSKIESQINSRLLNPRARLQKIVNWIGALQKIKQAEKIKKTLLE
jgi:hypothetical protein